jgi:hypothetical protein
MKFELEPHNRHVPDDDLIADLQRVANEQGRDTLTKEQYRDAGRFGVETIRRRFGSWNAALEHAGVGVTKRWRMPNETLFENLETIWRYLGRQPRRADLDVVATEVSRSVYEQRFGSWRNALKAFVDWINAEEPTDFPAMPLANQRRRTPRQPSLRLRFRVMRQDRFCCRHCGRNPANTPGLELHVDHITAWSKGGETTLENMQTLCDDCNLGKSNLAESQ